MKLASSPLFTWAATLVICAHGFPLNTTLAMLRTRPGSYLGLGLLGNPYGCWDPQWHGRRANFGDCAKAIAKLPNLGDDGVFGTGGNPNTNPYYLPRTERYDGCEISVTTSKIGVEDASSWDSISLAALKLIEACSKGYGNSAMTGGETTAGQYRKIDIYVGYHDRERPGNSESTNAATS